MSNISVNSTNATFWVISVNSTNATLWDAELDDMFTTANLLVIFVGCAVFVLCYSIAWMKNKAWIVNLLGGGAFSLWDCVSDWLMILHWSITGNKWWAMSLLCSVVVGGMPFCCRIPKEEKYPICLQIVANFESAIGGNVFLLV